MRDREAWQLTPDGIEQAFEHLMPRSAGAIIREVFYGAERFDELVRRSSLPRSVVAHQLERLVAAEVLHRVPYQTKGSRTRDGYHLTPRGRDLGVILVAMMDWSQRWLLPDARPGVLPIHTGCGATVHIALRCDAGHALQISEVEAAVGPGAVHRSGAAAAD